MALDRFQQAAVDCDAPHVQIVGHPGTGKTMVMGNRIARLLREGVAPSSIVALTFSNSARTSLKERLGLLLGDTEAASAVEVNTFHSFCANLISSFPDVVGLDSDWRMIDQLDLYNVLGEPALGLGHRSRAAFPRGYSDAERERFRNRLAQDKSFDFETAMELGTSIARQRDLGVKHLLIDEFQDGQVMQWELVKAICDTSPGVNICVVGDANQEIFTFRDDHLPGAFEVMRRTFPDTEVLDLRYNYRSSPEIVRTFAGIVPADSLQRPQLIATRPSNLEPELSVFSSGETEMAAIADLVARLKQVYKPSEIGILARYNQQVLQIKRDLGMRGIETSSAVNLRALAAKPLPNLTMSLLKWANEPRDLYLAQLLYNKHHKFISDQDFARLCRDNSNMLEALSQLGTRYSGHPFLVSELPKIRESLLSCATVPELVDTAVATVEKWRGMTQGHKRKLHPSVGWAEFKDLLSAIDVPMEPLQPEPEAHPTVLKAVLRRLFLSSDTAEDSRVDVQTIHSAKSREWRSVIVAGRAPAWSGAPFEFVEDAERKLLYVAASRAREQLYFTSGAPISPSNFLKFLRPTAPAPQIHQRTAAGLYPKQYLKILARASVSRQLFF